VKKMLALLVILLVAVIVVLSFPSTAKADGYPCSGAGCRPMPPSVSLAR
jgi:hypothetical protein